MLTLYLQHKAAKHGQYASGGPFGSEVCDVCTTAFDDDFQLRQGSSRVTTDRLLDIC